MAWVPEVLSAEIKRGSAETADGAAEEAAAAVVAEADADKEDEPSSSSWRTRGTSLKLSAMARRIILAWLGDGRLRRVFVVQ